MLLSCISPLLNAEKSSSKVIPFDEIEWGYLNPLRGEKSPAAADLWGDRTGARATGMLVRFNKGFSSPPHIHNVSYRGIVIKGLLHNDDPAAGKMWLTPGSFWTQPAGEVHITAAQAQYNLAYVEIDSGPYLVKPANEAFDNGEIPINVDQSNLSWIDATDVQWMKFDGSEVNSKKPQVAFLWGSSADQQLNGLMLKLPPLFKGKILGQSDVFKGVVIQGEIALERSEKLKAGSFFESKDTIVHNRSTREETIIYLRATGKIKLMYE